MKGGCCQMGERKKTIEVGQGLKLTRMSKSSWFKIERRGKIIHIDPGFAGLVENQGIPEEAMKDFADLILISHPHKDHVREEAFDRLWTKNTVVIAPKACQETLRVPFCAVRADDEIDLGWILVKAVHAYNTETSRSTRKYHPKGEFVGFVVQWEDQTMYFAGDTDEIEEMKQLGQIDIAFLPIGGTYVMDIDEAVDAVKTIQPKMVIPMHHATSDMTEFKEKIRKQTSVCVLLMNTGESAFIK